MITTSQWTPYYKRSPDAGYHQVRCETNLMYTPLVNPEGNVMCMYWDHFSDYQNYKQRPAFNEELLSYFFDKEVKYLSEFQEFSAAPRILDIDYNKKKVFIEWKGETCNDIVFDDSRELNNECPEWKQQLSEIVTHIFDKGIYKTSLYPHCFFIDQGQLKTIDWYACFPKDNCLVDYGLLKGMTGNNSSHRFEEALVDNKVDFSLFFKRAIREHVKWPENPLPSLYQQLYGETDGV